MTENIGEYNSNDNIIIMEKVKSQKMACVIYMQDIANYFGPMYTRTDMLSGYLFKVAIFFVLIQHVLRNSSARFQELEEKKTIIPCDLLELLYYDNKLLFFSNLNFCCDTFTKC